MRKPNESLDDFVVKPAPEISAEPPRPVSVRLTGEVEVLKPLARWERRAKLVPVAAELRGGPQRLSWFHRSLAMGGGLAIMVLIFASAIFIGISDPPDPSDANLADVVNSESDLGVGSVVEDQQVPDEEPLQSDIFSVTVPRRVTKNVSGSNTRRRSKRSQTSARLRFQIAAHRTRRQPRRLKQAEPNFIPTTLVIYLEKGEVKKRIEPQLTASYKNPATFSN